MKLRRKWLAAIGLALGFLLCALFGCNGYVYEEERFVVTFMNGEELVLTEKVKPGSELAFPADTPVRDEDEMYTYTFKGWNYTGDVLDDLVEPFAVEEDVTLYAVFAGTRKYDADVKLFSVVFRDSYTDNVIPVRDPMSGERLDVQQVAEGNTAIYPAAEDIPDHTDEYWMFDDWSEPQGALITAPTIIYATYKPTEYSVYMHMPAAVYEREEPVAYKTELVLPKNVSALGDPDLTDAVFSIDGWFWDEDYTQPVVGSPLVDADLLNAHAEDDAFHVYAKCSLKMNEGYLDVQSSDASADLVYGMDIYARVRGLTLVNGLKLSYAWSIERDGQTTASAEEVYTLRDAGTYRLSCVVTIVYGENLLSTVKTYELGTPVVIGKAALTAAADVDRYALVYGDSAPKISMTYTGFRFDDNASIVTPAYTYYNERLQQACDAARLPAGDYRLETELEELANYSFEQPEDVYFSVAPKALTLTLSVESYTYGTLFAPVIGGLDGLAYDESLAVLGTPVYTVNGTARARGDVLDAGSYTASLSGLSSGNYTITYGRSAAFTVAKRAFNVVTTAEGCVYGEVPEYGYEIVMLGDNYELDAARRDEDLKIFTPTYTFKRNGGNYADAPKFREGSYTVRAELNDTYQNYRREEVRDAAFVVAKKDLVISVGLAASFVYGEQVRPQVLYDGFIEGEGEQNLELPADSLWSYFAEDGSRYVALDGLYGVGSYTVKLNPAFSADNYSITFAEEGTKAFTVTKKPLTLTVHLEREEGLVYGDTPRAASGYSNGVEYEESDFVGGQNVNSLFPQGAPRITYLNEAGEPVSIFHAGDYTATVRASLANYEIVVKDVRFSIAKKDVSVEIKFTNLKDGAYEYGTVPSYERTYQGFNTTSDGDSYTRGAYLKYAGRTGNVYTHGELTAGAKRIAADTYTITIEGLGASMQYDDYNVTVASGAELVVLPKTLTVSLSAARSYIYGTSPEVTIRYNGFAYGEDDGIFAADSKMVRYYYNGASERFELGDARHYPVGAYRASLDGLREDANSNYDIQIREAEFTVDPRPLTVGFTVSAPGFTYGEYSVGAAFGGAQALVFTPTYSDNFAEGEDARALGGQYVYTVTREGAAYTKQAGYYDAGSYSVSLSGVTSLNYAISFARAQTFTVLKRNATVSVTATGWTYGQTPEAWSYGEEREAAGYSFETDVLEEDREAFDFRFVLSRRSFGAVGGFSEYEVPEDRRFPSGDYRVTVQYESNDNYLFATVRPAEFTVAKKAVTVLLSLDGQTEEGGYSYIYGEAVTPAYSFEGISAWDLEDGALKDGVIAIPAVQFAFRSGETAIEADAHFAVGNTYSVLLVGEYLSDNYEVTRSREPAVFTVKPLGVKLEIEGVEARYVYGTEPAPKLRLAAGEALAYGEALEAVAVAPAWNYADSKGGDVELPHGFHQVGSYRLSGEVESANYTFAIAETAFEVTPATLTVALTADDLVYGEAFAPAYSVTGFVEALSADERLALLGTLTLTVDGAAYARDTRFGAAAHTWKVAGLAQEAYVARNYRFSENVSDGAATAMFTVTPRPVTVTLHAYGTASWTYGSDPSGLKTFGWLTVENVIDKELTFTAKFTNGEETYDLFGDGSKRLDAGMYTLSAVSAEENAKNLANYTVSYWDAAGENAEDGIEAFEVLPKTVTVTVEAPNGGVYGNVKPLETWFTQRGVLEGDDLGFAVKIAKGEDVFKPDAVPALFKVGTYTVSLEYTVNNNYQVIGGDEAKSFTVTPRPVTVTVRETSRASQNAAGHYTYGITPTFALDIESAESASGERGVLNEDLAEFGFKLSGDAPENTYFDYKADPYTVTALYESNENYAVTVVDAQFYVDRFVIELKTDSTLKMHWKRGAAWSLKPSKLPADVVFQGEVVLRNPGGEFQSGTYAANDAEAFEQYFAWKNGEASDFGITLNGRDVSSNFTFVYALHIELTDATITINLPNNTIEYDGTAHTFAASLEVVEEEGVDKSELETTYIVDGAAAQKEAPTFTDAGKHTVVVTVTEKNGEAHSDTFTVTINKAEYTVGVPAQTFTYNGSAQGNEITVSGVSGDKAFVQPTVTYRLESKSGDTMSALELIDANAYTVNYTVAGSKNYNEKTGSFTVKINRKAINRPTADTKTFTYNGGSQKYEPKGFDSDTMTIAQNEQTNANTYTVSVDLLDKKNYEWDVSGDTQATLEFDFTIEKADYVVTGPTQTTFTYNGSAQGNEITVKGVDGDKAFAQPAVTYQLESKSGNTMSALELINADTYTVNYTVAGSTNYNEKTDSFTVTIAKKSLAVFVPEAISGTYSAKDQFQGVTLQEGSNVAETQRFTVKYGKSAGALGETAPVLKNAESGTIYYQIVIRDAKGVDVTSNYAIDEVSGSYSFTIEKAAVTIQPQGEARTYTGEEQRVALSAAVDGLLGGDGDNYTLTYSVESGDNTVRVDGNNFYFTNVPANAVGDAGTYTVTVSLTAQNYEAEPAELIVTVNKAEAKITISDEAERTYTFTGAQQTVTKGAVLNHSETTLVYADNVFTEVSDGNGKQITVSAGATRNYKATSTTFTITVNKADYTVSDPTQTTFTYNGSAQGNGITVSGVSGDESFTQPTVTYRLESKSGNTMSALELINADTYTVNYTVAESQNYKEKTGSFTVKINRAQAKLEVKEGEIEKAELSSSGTEKKFQGEYRGKSFEIDWESITTSGLENDAGYKPEFSVTVSYVPFGTAVMAAAQSVEIKDAGTYTITIAVAGSGNYEGTELRYTVVINRKAINRPTTDTKTFTYNGGSQKYEPKGFDSDTMTIANHEQTNANTYTVLVDLSDKTNYEWNVSGDTQATLKFTFTIEKATISLSSATENGSIGYDGRYHFTPAEIFGKISNVKLNEDGTLDGFHGLKLTDVFLFTKNGAEYPAAGMRDALQSGNSYAVDISIRDKNNFNEASTTYSFTITQKKITLKDVTLEGKEYDGTSTLTKEALIAKLLSPEDYEFVETAGDLDSVLSFTVKNGNGDGKEFDAIIDADTYTITVGINNKNYESNTSSYSYTIKPIAITVTLPEGQSYSYTGKEAEWDDPSITGSLADGEEATWSYSYGKEPKDVINVGQYSIVATLTIKKGDVKIPLSNYEITWPNETHTFFIEITAAKMEIDFSDLREALQGELGEDNVRIENGNLIVNYIYNYKAPTMLAFDSINVTSEVEGGEPSGQWSFSIEGGLTNDVLDSNNKTFKFQDVSKRTLEVEFKSDNKNFADAKGTITIDVAQAKWQVEELEAKGDLPSFNVPILPNLAVNNSVFNFTSDQWWWDTEDENYGTSLALGSNTRMATRQGDDNHVKTTLGIEVKTSQRELESITVSGIERVITDGAIKDFGEVVTYTLTYTYADDYYSKTETITGNDNNWFEFTLTNSVDWNIGSTYALKFRITVKENGFIAEGTFEPETWLKLKSVQISNDSGWYTIEDALNNATSGQTITVRKNTAFAKSSDVAQKAGYVNDDYYTVKSGVTLLVPYKEDDSGSTTVTLKETNTKLVRNAAYVTLYVTKNLTVNGTLNVNAARNSTSTADTNSSPSGSVSGDQYAQMEISEGVTVTIASGAVFESIGFTYGAGLIEAKDGSHIYEPFILTGWKGGTISLGIYKTVFPISQYSFNNIETKLRLYAGASYVLKTCITAGGMDTGNVDVAFLSNSGSSFMELKTGYLEKSVDSATGRIRLEVNGDLTFHNMTIKISLTLLVIPVSPEVSTEGLQVPIPGNLDIHVAKGTTTIPSDVQLKILPGAIITIEKEANLVVQGAAMSYGANNVSYEDGITAYKDGIQAYPCTSQKNAYRVEPSLEGYTNSAKVVIKGTVSGSGTIAVEVEGEGGAKMILSDSTFTARIAEDTTPSGGDGTYYHSNFQGKAKDYNGNTQDFKNGTWYYKDGNWISPNTEFSIEYQFVFKGENGDELSGDWEPQHSNPTLRTTKLGTFALAPAECEGLTFIGWYTDKSCTEQIKEISESLLENITIYGLFKKVNAYVVTYNVGYPDSYALPSGKDPIVIGSETVSDISGFDPETKYSETMTKYDYDVEVQYYFVGWYFDSSFATAFDAARITERWGKPEGSTPVTLYAKWEKKVKLTITLKAKGDGSWSLSNAGASKTASATVSFSNTDIVLRDSVTGEGGTLLSPPQEQTKPPIIAYLKPGQTYTISETEGKITGAQSGTAADKDINVTVSNT